MRILSSASNVEPQAFTVVRFEILQIPNLSREVFNMSPARPVSRIHFTTRFPKKGIMFMQFNVGLLYRALCWLFARRSSSVGILILLALVTSHVHAQTLTTLASFNGSNGSAPNGLTLGGDTLYGTTYGGGASSDGWGTVFSVPISGGTPAVLASFNGSNGAWPGAAPTLIGNKLYGTTWCGGASYGTGGYENLGYGTVFSVPIAGGNPTVLASFNGSDANNSIGRLELVGDTLYGTAQGGGGFGHGTVFSVPVSGGSATILTSFESSMGMYPQADLTLIGNALYGTCAYGGEMSLNDNLGGGVVFSVPVAGGSSTVLGSFSGSNGLTPYSGLTLIGNTLYGTTGGGGANNAGTVFSIPMSGGTPTVLASFNGSNGREPGAGLTLIGSSFYGTSIYGGAYNDGTVFSVPVGGGTPTVLVSFDGSNGELPSCTLVASGDTLYGTTSKGGAEGNGTVFALNLAPAATAWNGSGGGSWNTPSNWTLGTVPAGVGVQAVLGASATTSATITLDGNQTVGSLTFNNTASYTLAPGSGGTLTLNNSGGTGKSQLLVLAGSHTISAPVTIAGGNLTVTESSGSSLLISGNINDDNNAELLMLNGDGTGRLILSGTNTYGGGTIVEAGTLVITSAYALPDGTSLTVGAGGTFIFDPSQAASAVVNSAAAAAVPEPSTLALLGLGAIGLLSCAWRQRFTERRKAELKGSPTSCPKAAAIRRELSQAQPAQPLPVG